MMECESTSEHEHHPDENGVKESGGQDVEHDRDREADPDIEEGLTADSALMTVSE